MRPQLPSNRASRREFFRDGARYALAGGLAAIAATLASRRGSETCINEGICRGCAAYDDCGLPSALSAKQALAANPRGEP